MRLRGSNLWVWLPFRFVSRFTSTRIQQYFIRLGQVGSWVTAKLFHVLLTYLLDIQSLLDSSLCYLFKSGQSVNNPVNGLQLIKDSKSSCKHLYMRYCLTDELSIMQLIGCIRAQSKIYSLIFIYIYRLDAEAKGSTVFRIPEDVYKTRGR